MTFLLYPLVCFLAAASPVTLAQVQADTNPERRAKAAVEYAAVAERALEQANDNADEARMKAEISNMVTAMELARDSFIAAGKSPYRQPHIFKSAELQSHNLLHRLNDLRENMDISEKPLLDEPIVKIQKIHDAWFDGIMGVKK